MSDTGNESEANRILARATTVHEGWTVHGTWQAVRDLNAPPGAAPFRVEFVPDPPPLVPHVFAVPNVDYSPTAPNAHVRAAVNPYDSYQDHMLGNDWDFWEHFDQNVWKSLTETIKAPRILIKLLYTEIGHQSHILKLTEESEDRCDIFGFSKGRPIAYYLPYILWRYRAAFATRVHGRERVPNHVRYYHDPQELRALPPMTDDLAARLTHHVQAAINDQTRDHYNPMLESLYPLSIDPAGKVPVACLCLRVNPTYMGRAQLIGIAYKEKCNELDGTSFLNRCVEFGLPDLRAYMPLSDTARRTALRDLLTTQQIRLWDARKALVKTIALRIEQLFRTNAFMPMLTATERQRYRYKAHHFVYNLIMGMWSGGPEYACYHWGREDGQECPVCRARNIAAGVIDHYGDLHRVFEASCETLPRGRPSGIKQEALSCKWKPDWVQFRLSRATWYVEHDEDGLEDRLNLHVNPNATHITWRAATWQEEEDAGEASVIIV